MIRFTRFTREAHIAACCRDVGAIQENAIAKIIIYPIKIICDSISRADHSQKIS